MRNKPGKKLKVGGIILAAGMSKRMRSNKLLVPLGARPLIAYVLDVSMRSGLSDLVLVAGKEVCEFASELCCERVKIVLNRSPEAGMAHSVHLGVRSLGDVLGAMLILADQPFLRPFVIDTLIEAFERDPERIVAPLIRGRRSQPTLFPKAMFSELLEVSGDMGGRTVVVSHPELFTGVELAEW